jgi:hypothetical protein
VRGVNIKSYLKCCKRNANHQKGFIMTIDKNLIKSFGGFAHCLRHGATKRLATEMNMYETSVTKSLRGNQHCNVELLKKAIEQAEEYAKSVIDNVAKAKEILNMYEKG